jgi:hypothetical protein
MSLTDAFVRRPRRTRRSAAVQVPAAFVVGTPFSGATALAWAIAQHPSTEPVLGEKANEFIGALRAVDEELAPLRVPLLAGPTTRTLVVAGPELAQRFAASRQLFPGAKLIHVRRAAAEIGERLPEPIWRRIEEDCAAAEPVLTVEYADLVRRPEQTLLRVLGELGLEWSAECLWPLRLLSTSQSEPALAGAPVAPAKRAARTNDVFGRRLRQLVEAVVPPGARILVASRGDDRLLRFRDRAGTHFPQGADGEWAGFYPANGDEAIAHVRGLDASHLLFPHSAFWWLEHYDELRSYLAEECRLVACDLELGLVWELPGSPALELPESLEPANRTPREPDNTAAFVVEHRREPPRQPVALNGELWAVTTFYNPAGYHTKKANYDRFRRGLEAAGVPLLTVELAFGDEAFELSDRDADMLVQLRGGDVLWQKERLVNIGVQHLPTDCDRVLWVDADVTFARADWADETRRLLRDYAVVQPFSHCVRLPRGVESCEPATLPFGSGENQLFYGIAWGLRSKGRESLESYARHGHTGFAWAARRELLEKHGLYELNLLGNGDTDIAHAMFGSVDYWGLGKLGPHARAHLARWAEPFAASVGGSVTHVGGVVAHLWHGDTANRLYDRRLEVLHELDPERHVVRTADGLLALADDAPDAVRAWTRDYFASRREDG